MIKDKQIKDSKMSEKAWRNENRSKDRYVVFLQRLQFYLEYIKQSFSLVVKFFIKSLFRVNTNLCRRFMKQGES